MTGQGIHTDGANNGGMVCLERSNTNGAETQFHANIDGTCPLTKPFILEPGQGVFFKDNKVLHHAMDMSKALPELDARRTMIVLLDVSELFLLGKPNPNNTQRSQKSAIKLKNQATMHTVQSDNFVFDNLLYM